MRAPLQGGELASVRDVLTGTLWHTFTRTPIVEGTRTGYGVTPLTPGMPTLAVPCRYSVKTKLSTTPGGMVLATEPAVEQLLTVAWDDPIAIGDHVSNVRADDGQVLLVGPAPVMADRPIASIGSSLMRVLVLRGQTVERHG